MADIRYAIGIEKDEGSLVIKNPRRDNLCKLQEGVRFKTFTKRATAQAWVSKILERGKSMHDGLSVIIVPDGWGVKSDSKHDEPEIQCEPIESAENENSEAPTEEQTEAQELTE